MSSLYNRSWRCEIVHHISRIVWDMEGDDMIKIGGCNSSFTNTTSVVTKQEQREFSLHVSWQVGLVPVPYPKQFAREY